MNFFLGLGSSFSDSSCNVSVLHIASQSASVLWFEAEQGPRVGGEELLRNHTITTRGILGTFHGYPNPKMAFCPENGLLMGSQVIGGISEYGYILSEESNALFSAHHGIKNRDFCLPCMSTNPLTIVEIAFRLSLSINFPTKSFICVELRL